MDWLIKGHQRV